MRWCIRFYIYLDCQYLVSFMAFGHQGFEIFELYLDRCENADECREHVSSTPRVV